MPALLTVTRSVHLSVPHDRPGGDGNCYFVVWLARQTIEDPNPCYELSYRPRQVQCGAGIHSVTQGTETTDEVVRTSLHRLG